MSAIAPAPTSFWGRNGRRGGLSLAPGANRIMSSWQPEAGRGFLASAGRFPLAEGKVWSVRESGGTIYMNFGPRWTEALTVTISKREEGAFAASGMVPKRLESRRVRVRGWIEERNGPRIEVTRPEQIEI